MSIIKNKMKLLEEVNVIYIIATISLIIGFVSLILNIYNIYKFNHEINYFKNLKI